MDAIGLTFMGNFPFAVDIGGNLIWYFPWNHTTMMRPVEGGTFLVLANLLKVHQRLVEIDLAGNVIRETTAWQVSRQLIEMGQDPNRLKGFE